MIGRIDPTEPTGQNGGDLLNIKNITVISINNTTVLVTWNIIRNYDDDFCRQISFTWKLQILKWANWTALYHDANFKDIKKMEYYNSPNESMYVNLNRTQCIKKSYLLTGLSPDTYYKFQIVVNQIVINKIVSNGSYIHYFGKQS